MGYISREELDELGDGIAKNYLKSAGLQFPVQCIDIEGMAGFMGLTVVYRPFAEDDLDKIGFLSDGRTALKIRERGNAIPVIFPPGTIVLDQALHKDTESGRCRFTIAHEIAHFVLERHAPAARFHREFDSEREYSDDELRRQFNIAEAQADRLAAALLMPWFIVEQALKDFNRGNKIIAYGDNVIASPEKTIIQKMADQAGVSFTTMRIRLREFRLYDYHPLSEYVENILGGRT